MNSEIASAVVTALVAIIGAITTLIAVINKKDKEFESQVQELQTETSINGQLLQWMCEAENNYEEGHEKLDFVMQRVQHYCKTHDKKFDYGFYREKVNLTLRNLKLYKHAQDRQDCNSQSYVI
ncbi:MAG: hypothetical protein LBK70_00725 [Clostridiales bacterium]|jgi:hypothetical protein|nr:hypothetical protein [Clostridiales bacterium]